MRTLVNIGDHLRCFGTAFCNSCRALTEYLWFPVTPQKELTGVRSPEPAGHEIGPPSPIHLFECSIFKYCLNVVARGCGAPSCSKKHRKRAVTETGERKIVKHSFVHLPVQRLIIDIVRPNNLTFPCSTTDHYRWSALRRPISWYWMTYTSHTAVMLVHKPGEWKLAFIGECDLLKISCIKLWISPKNPLLLISIGKFGLNL